MARQANEKTELREGERLSQSASGTIRMRQAAFEVKVHPSTQHGGGDPRSCGRLTTAQIPANSKG